MEKKIRIFKSFEEQEFFFLKHFFEMTPSQRLQELARVQKKNRPVEETIPQKKITIRKHFFYGH